MALGLGKIAGLGILGQLFGGLGGNEKEQQVRMEGGWSPPNQQPTQVASNNTQQGQQGQGGFGDIMSGFSNSLFKGMSQEQVARLGIGFNSMTLRPDASLAASFQSTIDNATKKTNLDATVQALIKMGKPNLANLVKVGAMPVDTAMTLAFKATEKGDVKAYIAWLTDESTKVGRTHFGEYAEMLTFSPTDDMMEEITKMVSNDMGWGDQATKITYSAVKVDQSDGREYTIKFDPNQQKGEQVSIVYTGNIVPTEQELRDVEVQAKILAADQAHALEVGTDAFQQAQQLDQDVYNYQIALDQLTHIDANGVRVFNDDGARTGWIANTLPAMKKETALLRRVANVMGISVINMATFGALSEREMAMAMATNLDLQLPGQELVDYIQEMIDAKRALASLLYNKTFELTHDPEMTYSEWQLGVTEKAIEHDKHRYPNLSQNQKDALDRIVSERKYPEGYTGRDLWNTFNLESRQGFMK